MSHANSGEAAAKNRIESHCPALAEKGIVWSGSAKAQRLIAEPGTHSSAKDMLSTE